VVFVLSTTVTQHASLRQNNQNYSEIINGVLIVYDPTFIKYSPAYDLGVEEIPPPPPHKQTRIVRILLLTLFVLVLLFSITATWLYVKNNQNTTVPAPAYTAADLVKDFQAAHLKLWYVHYGTSISQWDADYTIPVTYTSSVTFGDITDCTGACTPGQIGLWVYATTADANSAYQDMVNTTPINGGGYLGIPVATVHGRCLLLGPGHSSTYVEVVKHKCS
jgi:hypothetical protein